MSDDPIDVVARELVEALREYVAGGDGGPPLQRIAKLLAVAQRLRGDDVEPPSPTRRAPALRLVRGGRAE